MNSKIPVKIYENNVPYTEGIKYDDLDIPLHLDALYPDSLYDDKNYNQTFYKWLNKEYTHNKYKYKPMSINIDVVKFAPFANCSPGGLYFTDKKNLFKWMHIGDHLHEVKILPNTPVVYQESCLTKAKAPAIYLGREINQKTPEFFDMIYECDYITKYQKYFTISSMLEYSSEIDYNFLDKNISITDCVYKCIRKTQDNKINENILRKINEIYIPELKKKYITDNNCELQPVKKFEDFINKNISNTLINDLRETGSVISGSSVLKYMLNEEYSLNDLDIYCNEKNLTRIYKNATQHNLKTIKHYGKSQIGLLQKTYNMENIVDVYDVGIIIGNIIGIKIQIIVIKDEITPENFIKTNFDFDFCKCTYNGTNFKILESLDILDKTGKISDEYMNKCFKEKDRYSTYRISKTADRIIKYIKRGFNITNTDVFFENVIYYFK